jgi:hypothetical protein
MANNIQLDEGSSGKYTETNEVTSNIHRQVIELGGVSACKLEKGGTTRQSINCSSADTDYTATNAIAATTKYVVIYCDEACLVAMGETTATYGCWVGAGIPTVFSVEYTGVSNDDKIHAQCPVGTTLVYITEMKD